MFIASTAKPVAFSAQLKSLPGAGTISSINASDLLPPLVPNRFDDGVIPIADLAADIVITIPRPGSAIIVDDVLALYWGAFGDPVENMQEIDRYSFVSGDESSGSPFTLKITTDYFPNPANAVVTKFQIIYATLAGLGENPNYSDPLAITIDWQPPGGRELVQLRFDDVVGSTITPADLVAGVLPSKIPDYYDMATADVVMPWIGKGNPPTGNLLPDSEYVTVSENQVGQEVGIPFKEEFLVAAGDGVMALSFQLRDKAGNISVVAPPRFFNVVLNDAPANLLPPVVPLFIAEGIIVDAQCRAGIEVEVPLYDNALVGDTIVINWGGQHSSGLPVGDPALNPLLTIILPYALILAAGSGILQVTYTILRGTVELETSPATQVIVDLAIPAGPDPDPTTPENENLLLPLVISGGGVVNVIPATDFDLDATATISWLDSKGVPFFQLDDRVSVFWGTEALGVRTIIQADIDAAADLIILVSATIIRFVGTGPIPVSYAVSRLLSDSLHFGTSFSPVQIVPVISSGEIPGGGLGLTLPNFTEKTSRNVINRALAISLGGTPLRFQVDYANGGPGDSLTWVFQGKYEYNGTGANIPDTFLTGTHVVNADDLALGYYEVIIPTATLFKMCDLAAGIASYTASNSSGSETSADQLVAVSVRQVGSGPTGCEWPLP